MKFPIASLPFLLATTALAVEPVAYKVQLDVISEGFDGKFCWFHPRAGAIPRDSPTFVLPLPPWRRRAPARAIHPAPPPRAAPPRRDAQRHADAESLGAA